MASNMKNFLYLSLYRHTTVFHSERELLTIISAIKFCDIFECSISLFTYSNDYSCSIYFTYFKYMNLMNLHIFLYISLFFIFFWYMHYLIIYTQMFYFLNKYLFLREYIFVYLIKKFKKNWNTIRKVNIRAAMFPVIVNSSFL